MKMRIKIQGFLIVVGVALIIILFRSLSPVWQNEGWDELFDILGIGFVVFGFLFRVSARGYKEEGSKNGNKLVTQGPYVLARNPMYLGTLFIGIGFVSILLQWWILLVFFAVHALIYVPQVNREEKILTDRFGTIYHDYCQETPRYLPRLSYLLNFWKYLPVKIFWVKKELPSIIPAVVMLLSIEMWEDAHLFGFQELFHEPTELLGAAALFIVLIWLLVALQTSK